MSKSYYKFFIAFILITPTICNAQTKITIENEELRKQVLFLSQKNDSLKNVIRLMQQDKAKTAELSLPWDQLEPDIDDMRTMFFDASETPEEKIQRRLDQIDFRLKIPYNETLLKYIRFYSSSDKFRTDLAAKRYDGYKERIANTFKQYGIPDFLVPLCIVESACRTNALSWAGAAGMWQLMPGSATDLGLIVNEELDERYDFEKSTDAAARYLKFTFAIFGDWRLTVAAYNCGPQRVLNAIKKAGTKDYWAISKYLPKETQGYLPSLIAVLYYLDFAR